MLADVLALVTYSILSQTPLPPFSTPIRTQADQAADHFISGRGGQFPNTLSLSSSGLGPLLLIAIALTTENAQEIWNPSLGAGRLGWADPCRACHLQQGAIGTKLCWALSVVLSGPWRRNSSLLTVVGRADQARKLRVGLWAQHFPRQTLDSPRSHPPISASSEVSHRRMNP